MKPEQSHDRTAALGESDAAGPSPLTGPPIEGWLDSDVFGPRPPLEGDDRGVEVIEEDRAVLVGEPGLKLDREGIPPDGGGAIDGSSVPVGTL